MDVHASCRQEVEQARADLAEAKTTIQSQADEIDELKENLQRVINQAGTCCDEN